MTATRAWKLMHPLPHLLGLGLLGLSIGLLLIQKPAAIALTAQNSEESPSLMPPLKQRETGLLQGNTVSIGDATVPLPWQQQGNRIGVADIPLMHHLGVELQNTAVAGQQPVLWFSEQPQTLTTWLANGHRYVDITPWANQQGWQLQPTGNRLRIQAPVGTVLLGRRGRQSWGDRLVLEVDRPVLWSLVEEPTTFTLTLQANAANSFDTTALTTGEGNVLNTLQVQPSQGKIQIRGTFDDTARPRVWSLTNPNRIVIDLTQADLRPKDILWAPGLRWREEYLTVGNRAFPVHQVRLNLGTNVSMRPIWPNPDRMPGTDPLVTTARNWGTVAAINGGFFNRNNQLPLGAVRSEGRWISGPILNRGAIAWNNQGSFLLSRLFLTHRLSTNQGSQFTVGQVNSGYVQAGIGLYTPAWGSTYTPIIDNETLVTVSQNQVIQQTPASNAGSGSYSIPAEGYLLAVRSYSEAVRSLSPGTTATLTPEVRPSAFGEFPYAIGGGPLLVQGGRIVVDAGAEGFSNAFATQAAPRSAIGITPDGTVLLVAIHYSPGGRGPTLQETAQIMVQLGAQDALNLDGGNSSSLYLGGSLINRHRGTVGRVHNGLGIFLPPTAN
ncbi:MAG: phosphodiester glycosidase family protein [Leptolyngbya sp. SIO1D8]|nr:phosphodiester glycosidase family protein [Leptolyngbya sp. SIO1D8]